MRKIEVSQGKILKLQNLLSVEIDLKAEDAPNFDVEIQKMSTFIKTHGANQIGPLIQYSYMEIDENGEPDVKLYLMLQSDRFIHNVEIPYKMQSVLRVKNCIYARYMGPSEYVKFACDKIGIYAFENCMEVDGSNYTIYISQNEEDETMVADVFMPIKE